MNSDQIIALVGAVLLAFIVRVFNVVVEWLSRILGVDPPDPIPTATDVHSAAVGAPGAPGAPTVPPAPERTPTGTTGTNGGDSESEPLT